MNPLLCHLSIVSPGRASGRLEGHPSKEPIEIRTYRNPDDNLVISWWRYGYKDEESILQNVNGRWVGQIHEFNAVWCVTGTVGNPVLEFREREDVGA